MAAHGRFDVLVNNAATYVSKPLLDTSLAAWERVFAVNVTAVFLLLQAAVRHMLTPDPDADGGRGRIVNISSQHGFVGAPLDIAYGTSKRAVVYLSGAAPGGSRPPATSARPANGGTSPRHSTAGPGGRSVR